MQKQPTTPQQNTFIPSSPHKQFDDKFNTIQYMII